MMWRAGFQLLPELYITWVLFGGRPWALKCMLCGGVGPGVGIDTPVVRLSGVDGVGMDDCLWNILAGGGVMDWTDAKLAGFAGAGAGGWAWTNRSSAL
jgi:hypothetical protein